MAAPAFSVPNQNAARLADPALREALLKYARRRLPAGEVEDLVQNTLTEALVSENAPSDSGDFQRWVHGIARHKIADSYRRRGRLPILETDLDSKAADAATGTGELRQWIERELPNTDGAHATLHWLLREGDGESLDEIARDAALPAPRVRQRVSRLRRHFHARWLALGAAGLILLIGAGLLLHGAREPSPVPPIARESVPPLERARALREHALEQCAAGAYQPCIAELDRAKALDPSGEVANAVSAARSAAARALQPAPLELEQKAMPKQLAPSKNRSKDIQPKAMPKKLQQKQKPMAPIPSKNAAPSKQGALQYDDLGAAAPAEQFAGSKARKP